MSLLAPRHVCRVGAVGVGVLGLLTVLWFGLPRVSGPGDTGGVLLGLGYLTIACLALWRGWGDRDRDAAFALAVVACTAIGLNATVASALLPAYSACFVVVFVWTGLALGRLRATLLGPFCLLSQVLPHGVGKVPYDLSSALIVTAVCVGTGEALSWLAESLRRSDAREQSRRTKLQRLVDGSLDLARQSSPTHAGDAIALLAADLLEAPSAALLTSERSVVGRWPAVADEDVPGLLAPAPLEVPIRRGLITASAEPCDDFSLGLVRTLAAQAGIALERLAETQRLRDSAHTDPLTGLRNRRGLDLALADLRPGDLLVLVDVDHFKAVNDTLGHAAGDEVLVALARHLESAARDDDVVARLGGEEFVVVAKRGAAAPQTVLRRLASGWDAAAVLAAAAPGDGRTRSLLASAGTFSAGAAAVEGPEGAAAALAAADQALYAAKGAGRACGFVAGAATEPVHFSARTRVPMARRPLQEQRVTSAEPVGSRS